MKRTVAVVIVLSLSLSGCAQITHLKELLTIKRYSDNKDMQDQIVWQENDQFEELLGAIANNEIEQYRDKQSFVDHFGDPVLISQVERKGKPVECWLYRYPVRYFGSKVYCYFDSSDKLIEWEVIEAEQEGGANE